MSKPNLAAQPSQQSKGDLKSGTIQTQQTGSTLNIDRSNDPRFQKRIPDEFYTREEKNFEPLPSHWETGIYGGRKYFVNHKAKTTSWIDPRTKKTRKHDLDKIEPGELPYGWEEAVDRHFGVYYINHIVQANYPDPPWDPIVKQQASELQRFVDEQIRKNEEALLEIERKEQEKIDAAAKRVEELEAAKIRIEAELLQLRQQALADVDVSESETSDASSIYSVSSTVTERELEQNLQQIEKEIEEIKPSTIPKSKEEFQQRLQDLVELNKRLAAGGPGYDGVAEYKKTEEELKTVSDMLKREAESRAMLEEQILALKRDMEMLYGEEAQPKEDEEEEEEEEEEDEEPINIIQKMSQPEFQFQTKANLNRKTRYEMELELLNLKKKLVSEKLERERLARLKDQIDSTPDTGKMPGWIKQINEVAASSKTLRVKIGQKQASSPDALSFRERMLFFASGKDAASKAKIDVPKKK